MIHQLDPSNVFLFDSSDPCLTLSQLDNEHHSHFNSKNNSINQQQQQYLHHHHYLGNLMNESNVMNKNNQSMNHNNIKKNHYKTKGMTKRSSNVLMNIDDFMTNSSQPTNITKSMATRTATDGNDEHNHSGSSSIFNDVPTSSSYSFATSSTSLSPTFSSSRFNVKRKALEIEFERKKRTLEKNRVAASKCREKKRQKIQELEEQSKTVSETNKNLQLLVSQLKEEKLFLRNQLLLHQDCECLVIRRCLEMAVSGTLPGTSGVNSNYW